MAPGPDGTPVDAAARRWSAVMRIGVSPYGSDRKSTLEFVDAAVAGGIDSLWLGDGMFRRPDFAGWRGGLESMVELAWLAGRQPSVRIGITAAVLPLRDMDWLVREALTLDNLTEGRFVLAVAAGFWPDELRYKGIDPEARGAAFRERLAQLRGGLVGELLSPPAHSDGGPQVWLAGGEPTMRLAASLGLPYQASRLLPDALEPLARHWAKLGGGLLAHRIYIEVGGLVPDGQEVARHALTGPPEALLAGLKAYAGLGVGDLSLVLGHDDTTSLRTLSVLVDEVLPQLGGDERGD